MAHTFPLVAPRQAASSAPANPEPGVFRRVLRAVTESRHRRAEREIERYIAASGFTDSIEREIERRYLSNPSDPI